MSEPVVPSSLDELRRVVAEAPSVIPVGNLTKPLLSAAGGATPVSLRGLSGLIEYEPSEFTFTAWAGTRVSEIAAKLAERQQYLPFDPPMVDAGCTLGGVVASGISGPGRVRYGGIRDFLLGVRLVGGGGELWTVGGKVVKNAAGFDVPKLLVGSLGRLGVMAELTFKVFPDPPSRRTLRVTCRDTDEALVRLAEAARSRWEIEAAEYRPGDGAIDLRLAGPVPVVETLGRCVIARWPGDVRVLEPAEADRRWRADADWTRLSAETVLVKVPVTIERFRSLAAAFDDVRCELRLGGAGTVAWIVLEDVGPLAVVDRRLKSLSLPAMTVYGPPAALEVTGGVWIGRPPGDGVLPAIRDAIDPGRTFPPFPGIADPAGSEAVDGADPGATRKAGARKAGATKVPGATTHEPSGG